MEQVLYAQVVKLSRKDLELIAANKNTNESNYKFHGQSARSQRWFDLDFYWIEVKFSTHEPDCHKKLFQSHDDTQDTNASKFFQVTIGNSKCVENSSFTMMPQCSSIVRSC